MTLGIDASRAEKGQHTGVEWYSIHILKALMPIVPSDWQVVLYSRGGDLSALGTLPANWRIRVIKAPLNRAWTILALTFYFLRGNKPDVFFEPSHIMPFGAPKKSITMIHDIAWRAHPETYSWQGKIILEQSLRHAKKAVRVLVPTQFVKESLVAIGFASEKIVVVPHGLDQNNYRPYDAAEVSSVVAKYNLTKPYVLCVGRIEEKKNTGRLLEAWGKSGLAATHELVLIGKIGFGGASLVERAKKTPGVRMLGWCSEHDLPYLYAGARAVVHPSLYEGFGFPVIQAAACAVPVVASDILVLKEVLGEGGIWVNPEDSAAIASGLRVAVTSFDQATLNRSREFVKKYTWEHAAKLTWEAICSLIY